MSPHRWSPLGWTLLLSLAACATPGTVARRSNSAAWLREGVAQGLPVEDPLAFGPAAKEQIRTEASVGGSERSQMRRLLRYLVDEDGLGFRYRSSRTLNAEAAFAAREGDCMSYALLYVAAARSLGLHVHFVRITQVPVFWQENGSFFTSSHIAVAHGHDTWVGEAMVVDFAATHTSAWRFALYDEVEDDTAFVLFHSNRAVELLLAGRTAQAEQLLRFFLERAPGVVELHNNLGIVLLRQHRAGEALELYTRAIERFPRFVPLYSNAVVAAGAAGDPELAERWAASGRKMAQSDPAFTFAEGMLAFRRKDYAAAASHFEQVLRNGPDDLTLLAWTARAHLSAGDLDRGQSDVERMRRQKPSETQRALLEDLAKEFPQAGIHPPAPPTTAVRS
jgi:tetratricopeptide (TPR) repeat protein